MNTSVRSFMAAVVGVCVVLAYGNSEAARIYFSESNSVPDVIAPTLTLDQGDSASLFVWVAPDTGTEIDGIGLSVRASNPNVVNIVTHEVFNPDTDLFKPRWNAVGAGLANQSELLIAHSSANAALESLAVGLNPDSAADDPLAVINGDVAAFLFSRIDIAAVTPGASDLFLQVGQALITLRGSGADPSVIFGDGNGPAVDGGQVGATDALPDAFVMVIGGPDGITGDTNGDGLVNIDDLNAVRNNFGAGDGSEVTGIPGDAVPLDGFVNIDDLNAVRNNFGAGTASVPEPSAILLATLAIGFGSMLIRRRRENGDVGCNMPTRIFRLAAK